MCGNHISVLPHDFDRFVWLKELNLSQNAFQEFPAPVLQLDQLRHLYLAHNYLTELPSAIGAMVSLEHLSVSHNMLRQLPDALGRLQLLKTLDVSHNRLTRLPTVLGAMRLLSALHAEGNPLQHPPPAVVLAGLRTSKACLIDAVEGTVCELAVRCVDVSRCVVHCVLQDTSWVRWNTWPHRCGDN